MYSASSSRHHSSPVTSDIVAQCPTNGPTVTGEQRPKRFVTPMLLCRFIDHPNPEPRPPVGPPGHSASTQKNEQSEKGLSGPLPPGDAAGRIGRPGCP